MRFLPLVGLYQKPAGAASLASGVSWSTQPTDIPYNALAVEDGRVYEFIRISGTCTVGDLLCYTGTAMQYVSKAESGVKPAGVSLVAPTASGDWSFIQKYGKNTSIQITNTFGATDLTAAMYGGAGSAAFNLSAAAAWASGTISGGTLSSPLFYIGQSLTVATGSQTVGFLELL